MADASDSKSDEGDLVWVQVPSPACRKKKGSSAELPFFLSKAERDLSPGFKVYAPLRSAQSGCPPDILRPGKVQATCVYFNAKIASIFTFNPLKIDAILSL